MEGKTARQNGYTNMTNKQLIKEIKGWLKDYEGSFPDNVCIDDGEDNFEGSAHNLLGEALYALQAIDKKISKKK